jgi:hypothetical protein
LPVQSNLPELRSDLQKKDFLIFRTSLSVKV